MHFVTGGAFNGKRKWVRKNFQEGLWISAYDGKSLQEDLSSINSSIVVLEGLEIWIKNISKTREEWQEVISGWEQWEQGNDARQVIIIGTDIGKGIVPMEEEIRRWRDYTGWVYQDVVASCKKVDMIWYGINQTIKG